MAQVKKSGNFQEAHLARVLVTGGAGFVGSHIVDGLLENGHEVLVVDDLSTGARSNLPANAEFVDFDVANDGFVSVVKSFGPDVISHLAAQSSVPVSMSDPNLDARVNIFGGLNVIRGAIEAECEQVVYVNTGGALYGEPEYLPCDEDHPIRPISAYGLSKWTAECYFRTMLPDSIPLKVLRPANIYGPRQDPHGESGVIAIFLRKMLRGDQVTINGDGEHTRDYVYVGDIVEAHEKVMKHGESLVVNIGTGEGTSVNEIFRRLQEVTGYGEPAHYGPPRPGDVRHIALDASRARRELGWEPKVGLIEGLKMTAASMRNADE
ncbi:MAG: NAD-dependent epimerase/dehydratase family protein [Dehalococcoidia bacterium]|nr:NAD-dependent epimerase/dehydratase family protein [Dehalococcoidia bacterium]